MIRSLSAQPNEACVSIDRLNDAVVVTDGIARVTEMNKAAERMVRLDDGLAIRQGQLCARRDFEAVKLAKFIAGAAVNPPAGAPARRMLVGRSGGRLPYCLTVVPLGGDGVDDRRAVMVIVADPDEHPSSESELAELFGLTPAESRLAAGLVAGKTPRDMAIAFGLQITTLRTQIRAILKKVGVHRQIDLIRVVSSIPHIG